MTFVIWNEGIIKPESRFGLTKIDHNALELAVVASDSEFQNERLLLWKKDPTFRCLRFSPILTPSVQLVDVLFFKLNIDSKDVVFISSICLPKSDPFLSINEHDVTELKEALLNLAILNPA